MSGLETQATVDEAAVGAFAQRVLADGTASITMLMAALGDRLGLFRALAEGGPATPAQLAERAGIVERYAREWLAHLPAVDATLRAGADVADVGCGAGRALIELARAYPRSRFVGFDTDPDQIQRARANATAAGVADRVRLKASTVDGGPYDVVLTFDVVHDAGDPLGLLRAVRAALRPGGTYLCAEVNSADTLAGNLNPFGALYYGVSVLYCLSVSLAAGSADAPGAGLGSLGLPEAELAKLCARAGFATVRRLPVDDPMNAVYEVRP